MRIENLLIPLIFFLPFSSSAQNKNIFDVARKGTLEEIKLIYQKNSTAIDSLDARKSTPLILACYRGNTEVALFLADKTKNINYNSGMGTALMAAVMSDKIVILEKLISLNADVNQIDLQGKTALIYAVLFNKNESVKLLLKAGAKTNLKGNDDKTALDFANFNKNTELIILLDK